MSWCCCDPGCNVKSSATQQTTTLPAAPPSQSEGTHSKSMYKEPDQDRACVAAAEFKPPCLSAARLLKLLQRKQQQQLQQLCVLQAQSERVAQPHQHHCGTHTLQQVQKPTHNPMCSTRSHLCCATAPGKHRVNTTQLHACVTQEEEWGTEAHVHCMLALLAGHVLTRIAGPIIKATAHSD